MDTQQVKEQICAVRHKMRQLGWVAANDGNVSVKMDDSPGGSWRISCKAVCEYFFEISLTILGALDSRLPIA